MFVYISFCKTHQTFGGLIGKKYYIGFNIHPLAKTGSRDNLALQQKTSKCM